MSLRTAWCAAGPESQTLEAEDNEGRGKEAGRKDNKVKGDAGATTM